MPRPGNLPASLPITMRMGLSLRMRSPMMERIRTDPLFTSYGPPFLYTAANWGAVAWYLEVYMAASSGLAEARLWDNTANAAVAGSMVSDAMDDSGLERLRSTALTLTDGHEYQVQFGGENQAAGKFRSAKLIAV